MHWIRIVGSALALLLLMTSPAAADSSVQQLESSVRASLATIGTTSEPTAPAPAFEHARPSFKAPLASQVGELAENPMITTLRHIETLTGGWRVSAGISPGSQVLGVDTAGRIVEQRWMNFHISVGLHLK